MLSSVSLRSSSASFPLTSPDTPFSHSSSPTSSATPSSLSSPPWADAPDTPSSSHPITGSQQTVSWLSSLPNIYASMLVCRASIHKPDTWSFCFAKALLADLAQHALLCHQHNLSHSHVPDLSCSRPALMDSPGFFSGSSRFVIFILALTTFLVNFFFISLSCKPFCLLIV